MLKGTEEPGGGVILNLLIAPQNIRNKNCLDIILLSIFGFIDQPYKSKTYPTQPSKKKHMPMTPFFSHRYNVQMVEHDCGASDLQWLGIKDQVRSRSEMPGFCSVPSPDCFFLIAGNVVVFACYCSGKHCCWLAEIILLVGFLRVIRLEMLRILCCLD